MATVNSSNTTTLYSTTQTTPVKTGANIPQGQVNDTNFTTLYANTQGNATGGGVSSNLLVRGNLRVLGTSDLEGAVTISNSYIMPTTDGTNQQILTTDGNGNATWQNISTVAGYAIQADTATGGADLTLTQAGNPVDSVKFAGGTNITVSRSSANIITISTNADDIPNGTAQGQVLYWNGTAWVASSTITSSAAADRFILQYDNSGAGTNAAVFLRKNYGATAYTANDGVGTAFQLVSDSQTLNQIATINAQWKGTPAATEISLNTNSLDNTTGPFVSVGTFSTAQATLPGDLAVLGGDITTTNNIGNLFNTNATVVNIGNSATAEVNLGNISLGRVQVKSPQLDVSNNATIAGDLAVNGGDITTISSIGNLFNTNATTVNVGNGATTEVNLGNTGTGRVQIKSADLDLNGGLLVFRSETAGTPTLNAQIAVERGTSPDATITWDESANQWVLSDPLFISNTTIPANFERRVLAGNVDPNESANSLTLTHRVTDAVNNNTDDGGAALRFVRTSGVSGGAEKIYAQIGSNYYGTTNTADFRFNWSSDNFTESSPGVYPNTYTLLRMADTNANFFNNSIYMDYTTAGATRVGVNTSTPAYTLDVNGDANVSGDIYVSGYQFDINTPAAGQGIVFNGTKFANSSLYEFTDPTYRSSFINNIASGASISAAEVLKRRTSLVNGNSVAQLMGQIVGTTETYTHRLVSQYSSTGNNQFLVQIDPIGNFAVTSTTITSPLVVDNDNLTLVADTIILGSEVTGTPTQNAAVIVNRGSSAAVRILWDETGAQAGGADRWKTTTDGTNYLNIPNQNLDTDSNVTFASVTVDGGHTVIDTTTTTTTSIAQTAIVTTSNATTRSSKFQIQITDNVTGNIHVLEAMLFFQGATAYLTTYAEMYPGGSLATFAADVNSGNTRLLATPASANNTTFKVTRISVAL